MKIWKNSSFFDMQKNPYQRWGIKTNVSLDKMDKNYVKCYYSHIKITKGNDVFFFGGFDDQDNVLFVEISKAINADRKQCSKVRNKLKSLSYCVSLVRTTHTCDAGKKELK